MCNNSPSLCSLDQEAPRFLRNLSDHAVAISSSTTLDCRATGVPEPRITWFKNHRKIQQEPGKRFCFPWIHFLFIPFFPSRASHLLPIPLEPLASRALLTLWAALSEQRWSPFLGIPCSEPCRKIHTESVLNGAFIKTWQGCLRNVSVTLTTGKGRTSFLGLRWRALNSWYRSEVQSSFIIFLMHLLSILMIWYKDGYFKW